MATESSKATIREVYEINQRLEEKFDKFVENLSKNYVSMDRFWPVEKLVYGGVAFILLFLLGKGLNLIH